MHPRTRQARSINLSWNYSAFLPALFALAQRAFMRIEMLLLPASLIWPRLRGPAEEEDDDEARRVRPPVRASMAATTRSRCSVSASIIEGVSMALNYKTTCHLSNMA
jgi:hypothetical protein